MTEFPGLHLLLSMVFLVSVALTVTGALIAVLSARIIRGVCGLAICSVGLAGLFYYLRSPFLALMEILIYVGAVCVTIVFAVMLAEPEEAVEAEKRGVVLGRLPFRPGPELGFACRAGDRRLRARGRRFAVDYLQHGLRAHFLSAAGRHPGRARHRARGEDPPMSEPYLYEQLDVYLVLAAFLLAAGIYGLIRRRTLIGMLISGELIFAAASLNLMALNRFIAPDPTVGQVFVLFIMGLAAAEVAISLSIIIAVYRNYRSIKAHEVSELKG
jgi:NADH-quinone oxidoreductase subunit K